jgi:hypothetical protein
LVRAMEAQVIVRQNKYEITDGRILNTIESDYFLKIPRSDESFNYYPLNFCPFCGLPLSARAQGFD